MKNIGEKNLNLKKVYQINYNEKETPDDMVEEEETFCNNNFN